MQSVNPATNQPITEYPEPTPAELDAAIARAAACFAGYRRTSFEQRAIWMRRAAELLRQRRERYARLMTLEMGKTIGAAEAEVDKCAWACDYYAEHAAAMLADEPAATDAARSYVTFQPLGVVLAVMPWNFPFWQCFRFAAPALMAGNVGLLKHASNVPGSALAIEEVFRDAGFPEGAFQALLARASAVEGIIADPRIVAVTLTGSEAAGRSVGEAAGRNLRHVVLELGGSDPFIVMPSANIEQAAEVAVSARMVNNGQSCIAAKRFIVHEGIAERFQALMADRMRALRVGDPLDRATDVGPMARPEFAEELERQVRASIERGARLVAGGGRIAGSGAYFQPTLLANVGPGMPAYDEETFGPVAALIAVRDLEEAISVANDTRFGLGAAAWTGDPAEAERFVAEIQAGAVFINGMVKSDPRLPFGGVKASGVGRELGSFGIREFVNVKSVWMA
jgi:succinate-semialdehyde dehydrogenase/glutarate-semialdehyde dehydrogenase